MRVNSFYYSANQENPMQEQISFDALMPKEMANKAEHLGVSKVKVSFLRMFSLAILAGAFIALGAIFSTTATTVSGALPFGVVRVLGGVTFSLGLILVIVAGAELFTGNNLIVMAWASRKVSTLQLLRNWVIVYAGNFVGAILTAYMMFVSKQYMMSNGALGLNALTIAQSKTS